MGYRLSILDKSPIEEGETAADALAHSVVLARAADTLGYHRVWFAEHHGNARLASSAPEIVAAHVLAQTRRIRVGTGGVMLQHYSPYKVAETFRLLAALASGRVDLGVGKAPGGLPLSTKALQALHDPAIEPNFEVRLAELTAFLEGSLPEGHALAGLEALPIPSQAPERILLGGSADSAALAARHGWQFAYAGHFNGSPLDLERAARTYRELTGRGPLLALYAFAAPTSDEAARHVGALRSYKLHLPGGKTINVATPEAADEFARQAGVTDYRIEERQPQVIHGTADHVRRELDTLAARHGIAEFVIDIPVPTHAERLASTQLLAGASRALAA